MEYNDFEKKIEEVFTARLQGKKVSLKLTQVEKLKPVFPEGYTGPKPDFYIETPFSLTFCGPGNALLSSQIYTLTDDLGTSYDLFLSPFMQNSEGIFYEAVFK